MESVKFYLSTFDHVDFTHWGPAYKAGGPANKPSVLAVKPGRHR